MALLHNNHPQDVAVNHLSEPAPGDFDWFAHIHTAMAGFFMPQERKDLI
jgi:hypothetical protein